MMNSVAHTKSNTEHTQHIYIYIYIFLILIITMLSSNSRCLFSYFYLFIVLYDKQTLGNTDHQILITLWYDFETFSPYVTSSFYV